MTDTEPPYVIMDGEAPVDRYRQPPDAHTPGKHHSYRDEEHEKKTGGQSERNPPAPGRGKVQWNARDLICDVAEALVRRQNGMRGLVDARHHALLSLMRAR